MVNEKVLLVEDDPVLQKLYKDLMESEEITVDVASEGDIAYNKIVQGGWNLILLDLLLPKITGVDILKKLQKNTIKVTTKIVFLTNLEHGKEMDEIKRLGYNFIIKSSLSPDQFVNKIKSFLF